MEKYKILIKRSVEKDLQTIPKKDVTKILKIIEALADNPYPSNVKKLSHGEKYRIRFRQYRILYRIENEILTIYIVKVAHRKDVYR
ncbi:MAG: type II toxin-antitoxin system RelE/ParE family toxin [Candidatus Cloacimonadota bacterium]|nr:type II toxin-antitoxin system RelE/ParE family toxin [Candidatus Cloacimonadota bacterium]